MIQAAFLYDTLKLLPAALDYFKALLPGDYRVLYHGMYFPRGRRPQLVVLSLAGEDVERAQRVVDDVLDYAAKHPQSVFVAVWFTKDTITYRDLPNLFWMHVYGVSARESLEIFDRAYRVFFREDSDVIKSRKPASSEKTCHRNTAPDQRFRRPAGPLPVGQGQHPAEKVAPARQGEKIGLRYSNG